MNRKLNFLAKSFIESPEQSASSCQIKPAAINISGQFRWGCFKRFQNGFFYFEYAFIEGFSYLLVAHQNLLGDTGYQVTAIHRNIIGWIVQIF
jgi:hypothetical protein